MGKRYKDAVIGAVLAVFSHIPGPFHSRSKRSNIDRVVGSRMFPQICGTVVPGPQHLADCERTKSARGQGKEGREAETARAGGCTRTVIVLRELLAAYIFLMDKLGFTAFLRPHLFNQMLVMGSGPRA